MTFIFCLLLHVISQGSSVSMTTRVKFLAGARIFSPCHCTQTSYGAQPTSYPVDTWHSLPVVQWPGHEANHSPPYVELYFHSPSIFIVLCLIKQRYIFMVWYLLTHRDNFTLHTHTHTHQHACTCTHSIDL